MSGTNRFKILVVRLDQIMFNVNSLMGLRSNIKILMFHIILKDWLINLTPSRLGSTSSLDMVRFSSVISQALFKYPCNSKDNFFNNKGNLCCSKGFLHNIKGRLSHNKVSYNNRKVNPSNSCSKPRSSRCNMLCIPLNPYPRRANLYKTKDKFCNRKVSKTNLGSSNPCIPINKGNPCRDRFKVKSCNSKCRILLSKANRFKILSAKGTKYRTPTSKGNKRVNLMPKDCRSKTLFFRDNRPNNPMFQDNWSHTHMSKVNKLSSLLTHMLPISNLCMDNFKVFLV